MPRRIDVVRAARKHSAPATSKTGVSGGTGGWLAPSIGLPDIWVGNARCSLTQADS